MASLSYTEAIALLMALGACLGACTRAAPPERPSSRLEEAPIAPSLLMVEVEGERREPSEEERRAWVALVVDATCALRDRLEIAPASPTSPETIELLGAFVAHRAPLSGPGFVTMAEAVESGAEGSSALKEAIARDVQRRCPSPEGAEVFRADAPEVVAALRVRRVQLEPLPSEDALEAEQRRYLDAATELACGALGAGPDGQRREVVLERHGYTPIAFASAAEQWRDDTSVAGLLARNIRRCAPR